MLIFCQHMHSDSTISCEIRSRTAKVLMDFLYSVSGKNDRAQFRSVIFLLFVTNSTVVLVVRNRQIVHILLFFVLNERMFQDSQIEVCHSISVQCLFPLVRVMFTSSVLNTSLNLYLLLSLYLHSCLFSTFLRSFAYTKRLRVSKF